MKVLVGTCRLAGCGKELEAKAGSPVRKLYCCREHRRLARDGKRNRRLLRRAARKSQKQC